ncbi:ATP-binding protein [Bifidobacterium sp. ESL0763]|uniref:ATP-binding protein n=1 Tax=Bifidobacterium sp. ESL0763 TaxID=2983227 RepID=UPI0023F71C2D|nr:ATP-binding protein [Bifidobacterium sp. ESL0763]MDF7663206.1 ATP-binding protein [Bifidobacterium sp. ESL0763]
MVADNAKGKVDSLSRYAEAHLQQRPRYLEMLEKTLDNGAVKVVTGMRRCGKSSLLMLLAQYLRGKGVPAKRIVTANLESSEFFDIADYRDLTAWLQRQMPESGHYYVLLDEPQLIDHWERAVNALRVDADADIYLTGSNAYLLSSQISTLLSGRYEEIHVHPLSFREFVDYAGVPGFAAGSDASADARTKALTRYLAYGGLPPVVDQGDDRDLASVMLSGIYNTVVVKDVAQHVQVRNMEVLADIARFLAETAGSSVSVAKIERRLAAAHRKPSGTTVERYVQGLVDAFLFSKSRRYDIRGGAYLQGGGKYYPADMGIRNMLLDFPASDFGFALENAVYNELLVRRYDVRVGRLGAAEVDFVAIRPDAKLAIQVTASMLDPKTRQRELEPLRALARLSAEQGIRRMVITYDAVGLGEVEGIEVVNAMDWLLG